MTADKPAKRSFLKSGSTAVPNLRKVSPPAESDMVLSQIRAAGENLNIDNINNIDNILFTYIYIYI